MSVENLKSTSVTNLDATPVSQNTAGEGGPALGFTVNDYATVSANASVTSTYQLCRVPSNCKVKNIWLESEAQAAGTFDIGLYYSSGADMPASIKGLVVPSCQTLFGSAIDCSSAQRTDVTNESTNFNLAKRNQPLWQAAGLTSDPGGFFDIVATVVSVAVTTGTGKIGVVVDYTQ